MVAALIDGRPELFIVDVQILNCNHAQRARVWKRTRKHAFTTLYPRHSGESFLRPHMNALKRSGSTGCTELNRRPLVIASFFLFEITPKVTYLCILPSTKRSMAHLCWRYKCLRATCAQIDVPERPLQSKHTGRVFVCL